MLIKIKQGIHGKTGFIASADVDDFSRAILRVLDNFDILNRMKLEARKHVSEKTFGNAYLKLWEDYQMQGNEMESKQDSEFLKVA